MRSVFIAAFVAAFVLAGPTGALAQPLPVFNGLMDFEAIQGPEDPEEYSWEVQLGQNQELREVSDQQAEVFYTDPEHSAFSIMATAAHDADGTNVPTTLSVTQPNIITLTVHHRSAPFDYPVVGGEGWEGGFHTEPVVITEPTREGPPPTCVVPDLSGRTLRASRKILHAAHCRLGAVRGERRREVHVVEQYREAGRSLPLWTRVDVKALRGAQYSRSS